MSRSTQKIREVVREWYGVPWMPMVLQTREEEVEEFETDNDFIPPDMWRFVNHTARIVSRWARDADIDFVVWNPASGSYRMVQDLVFKDEYPSESDWTRAIQTLVGEPDREVWVVFHGDDHPSNPA